MSATPHKPTQDAFVARRQRAWDELDGLVPTDKALHKLPPDRIARAGALYRSVCADLMRARSSGYTRDLVDHLDALAARAHNAIYRSEPYRLRSLWELVARDFPVTLRESWRFLAAAIALFTIPFAVTLWATLAEPSIAAELLPRAQLEMMAEAYAEGFDKGRTEGQDTMMAGFYVYNNVGVAFRCFATGIFFGLGSVYFLVFNGVYSGAVIGWVIDAGGGRNILTFVLGHGSFELTAIMIAGAAGMRMGYALVKTDGRTRLGSLRHQGKPVARLVLGAALMLGIAALIEGFWSPSSMPYMVKWSVAAALWLLVILYLALAGRWQRPEERVA